VSFSLQPAIPLNKTGAADHVAGNGTMLQPQEERRNTMRKFVLSNIVVKLFSPPGWN
jgi:hypothetical protein